MKVPAMKMARVILFTGRMDAMSKFYGKVLGLRQVTNEKGWQEFAAGGTRIALHSGPSSPGRKGPKIVFHAKDVAAMRAKLVARAQASARSARARSSACVTARTRTAIRFNCRIGGIRIVTPPNTSRRREFLIGSGRQRNWWSDPADEQP